MKYFKNVNTLEELKKEYRKLAKRYHPDVNVDGLEIMKAINNEYEKLFKELQRTGTKQEKAENVNMFKDIINKIISFDVEIEIVGTWIWLSGNTYSVKDRLKEIGFEWSRGKKKWYYFDGIEKAKKRKGTGKSYEEIKNMYGSKKVKSVKIEMIAG